MFSASMGHWMTVFISLTFVLTRYSVFKSHWSSHHIHSYVPTMHKWVTRHQKWYKSLGVTDVPRENKSTVMLPPNLLQWQLLCLHSVQQVGEVGKCLQKKVRDSQRRCDATDASLSCVLLQSACSGWKKITMCPFLILTSVCALLVTLIRSYLIILSKPLDNCFNLGVNSYKVSNSFLNNHLN